MKTAKILGGVAIGLALVGIGLAVFFHLKKPNTPSSTNLRTIDTDLDSVTE